MSTQVKRMYERCKDMSLSPLKVLTIILFLLPSIKSFAAYCVPTFTSYSTCVGGNITNVSIGTLTYSTTCMVGGGYRDLTSISTSFSPGQSYPVSLTIAGGGWYGGSSIWIDFDHDEVFSAGEQVFTTPYTGSSLHTGTLVIPAGVPSGPTRMRVMGRESSAPSAGSACGGGYGEAHDYTVIIGAAGNNASANAIVEPVSMAFCPGTYDVKARISNNGVNIINGVNVNWEVDGVFQSTVYWPAALDTFNSNAGNKALITLGSYTFTGGVPTTIKVWTSDPNGVADTVNTDDTVVAVITSACPVFPAPYCAAPVSGYVVPLTKVSFAGFVNPSSDLSTVEHEDFTSITGSIVKGGSSTVVIEGSTESAAYRYYARVYIDWNKNNNFNDPGESHDVGYLYNSTGIDGQTIQTQINVPMDAVIGTTRMRVTLEYNSYSSSACAVTYGQIEDYTLEILPAATNDARVVSYVKPAGFCPGSGADVIVKIGNKGSNIISYVNVEWEVDGVPQSPLSWGTPLDTIGGSGANEATVTLGNIVFTTDDPKVFKVWTAYPNGMADTSNTNDTITFTLTPALNGTFTIGATGADYATIADALAAMSDAGVCGPTVFNIQSGTYTGAVNIGIYNGVSALNTVTFKGAGTDSTFITHNGTTTVTLEGTDHFIFRDMTIANTSSSSGTVVYLTADGTDAADSNSIINCHILSPVAATSSSDHGVLASGYPGSLSDGNNANGTLVDSCYIRGGEYGVAFQNESVNFGTGNTVSNTTIDSTYAFGVTLKYQNSSIIRKNSMLALGLNSNVNVGGVQIRDCGSGLHIDKNKILGAQGGFGVYMLSTEGTVANPNIVSNNMIIIGGGTNLSLGVYSVWCNNVDFVYNTIDIRSNGSNSVTALLLNAGMGHTIANNIFRNTNAGNVIDIGNAGPFSNIKLDHNCYYGTGTYPFRFGGSNFSTLADFKTATGMIFSDSFSIFVDPVFFSSTDLRTNDIMVDGKGMYYANVLTDIDDSLRSTVKPDIGVNEFTLPDKEDAAVTAILLPKIPVTAGPSNVQLVIKNAGVGDLNSVVVNYEFDGTVYTQIYMGPLAQGESDTIEFNSNSGMVGNDQRFLIPSFGTFEIKAWTYDPNGVPDKETSNDSLSRIYCQPMHGTYTIDPAGSGPNNFVSFAEAIGGLNCGGISSAVVFEIASGTYSNTQFSVPYVYGSDSVNTITFRSAASHPDSVVISYASTSVNDNYVVELLATEYVTISNITLQNTGASFARAIYLNIAASKFNHHIHIDSCVLTGVTATTTNADLALVYGMENHTNLSFTNNRFNNGSRGIIIGGTSTKLQYSENLNISNNTFTNNYAGAMVLSYRNHVTVQNNIISATGSNPSRYAIYLASTAGHVKINRNKITAEDGTGIQLYQYCYYAEDGAANVVSNIVNLTGTGAVAQTGIGLVGSSIVNIYNNTVRIFSSSPTSRAMFIEGDVTYVNLQNLTTTGVRIANNIFHTQNGYPIYFESLWWNPSNPPISLNAIAFEDYNIYYTEAGDNVAYLIGTDVLASNFAGLKGSVNNSNDLYSYYLQPVYTPASNFTPDVNNVFAWYINGHGIQLTESDTDFTGAYRPTIRQHGVPDIGAHEITPAILPPLATAVPATAVAGGTQSFLLLGDTVARITWDVNSPNIPTAVDVRAFPGERPPFAGAHTEHLFYFVSLSLPSAMGNYSYTIELPYRETWLGTNANEQVLRMANIDSMPGSLWSITGLATTDSIANIMNSSLITTASMLFTGTNDNNPLPVKLISFSGKRASADAQLQWNTASEKQAGVFEVQRSLDGVSFEAAGTVKAKGNSNSAVSYRFTDVNVFSSRSNVWYYRLKMIDQNGSFEYSKVIRIENRIASADMSVYPNPASDVLNISVPQGNDHNATVSIKTVQGTEVMKATVDGNGSFTVPGIDALSNGLYIIELHYSGTVYTQKFTRL